MARSTRTSDADHYRGNNGDFGYYQRTNLQTMIDNFMVAYIGNDKFLKAIPRYEVAFHMQRCIQEFNYDIFHSTTSKEFELGPTLQLQMPSDYVNYVKIKRVTRDGRELELIPAPRTTAPQAVVQDQNYEPITDSTGDIIEADESETVKRWRDNTQINETIQRDYYYENYDGDFHDNYYTFYGRRYGLTPSDATTNGTFIIDNVGGLIYFDSLMEQGDLIILTYITDGLQDGDDLSNVLVPKLAEDAVYANVLYNLTKLRPSAGPSINLFKKEAKAKMANAKIRLMDLRPAELKNVLRNKSKWIKH